MHFLKNAESYRSLVLGTVNVINVCLPMDAWDMRHMMRSKKAFCSTTSGVPIIGILYGILSRTCNTQNE